MQARALDALLEGTAAVDGLCLVTCPEAGAAFTPLEAALRGRSAWIRTAGPVLDPDGETARAVAASVALLELRDVAVIVHEDCAFLRTDAATALGRTRARSVPRDSLGADARRALGLIGDARAAAIDAASIIRRSPQLPRDALVHALVLRAGRLELVERGEPAIAPPPDASLASSGPVLATMPDTLGAAPGPTAFAPATLAPEAPAPAEEWFGFAAHAAATLDALSKPREEPPPLPAKKVRIGAPEPAQVDLVSGRVFCDPPVELPNDVATALNRLRTFARANIKLARRREVQRAIAGFFPDRTEQASLLARKWLLGTAGAQSRRNLADLTAVEEAARRLPADGCFGLLRAIFE